MIHFYFKVRHREDIAPACNYRFTIKNVNVIYVHLYTLADHEIYVSMCAQMTSNISLKRSE